MSIPPIRVVIIDSPDIFRLLLKHVLLITGNFSVIAEIKQYKNAFDFIMEGRPDVVLLDMQIADGNALDLIRRLRACGSTSGILLLVVSEDSVLIRTMLDAGANSFVLKSASPNEIAEAILDVYEASQVLIHLPAIQSRTQNSAQTQKRSSV